MNNYFINWALIAARIMNVNYADPGLTQHYLSD